MKLLINTGSRGLTEAYRGRSSPAMRAANQFWLQGRRPPPHHTLPYPI